MNKTYYGAAYYPELWDEETICQDIEWMKKTGINVVRMGEFAWAKMEPDEDKIDVTFFVSIINRLYENGIETIFCTPTPTPPIWLSHNHPERMHVDAEGKTMVHGSRQHMCTNNDYVRKRSRIIVEAIAKAVGKLPGLIGWQTDNEFKCHVDLCFCESCKKQWHQWLQNRFETVDQLNQVWGTDIWSERYQAFEQVPQPLKVPFLHHASLTTTYRQFTREKIAEFQKEQIDIIRANSFAPITHNSSRNFDLDNELMFGDLDFASFDMYPNFEQYDSIMINGDISRNVKKGRPFWVMETSPSHNGSLHGHQKAHPNGFLTAEAVASFALGAEGFSYWLWRQQRAGCELPHSSILSAWGKPTVGYSNVIETNKVRKQIEPILLSTKPAQADVAMTYSDRARAYFWTESLENLDYKRLTDHWYRNLLNTGIYRDLIYENHELDGYKLLLSPFIPHLSDSYIERAKAFVEKGGVWIVGPMTGGRTEEHTVHTDAALGTLEAIAGVETLYSYPLTNTGAIGHAFGHSASLGYWGTVFELKGAETVGVTEGGITPDLAFLTEYKLGLGKVVMLGAMPFGDEGDQLIQVMIKHYANEVSARFRYEVSEGTVVIPRENKESWVLFIVNLNGQGGIFTLHEDGKDLLTETPVIKGKLALEPYEFRVISLLNN